MPVLRPDFPPSPAPRPWTALLAIAGYFALQFALGSVFALLLGPLLAAAEAAATLQALLAMLTLGVAVPLTLWLVHRRWPALWSQARPPGFGFVAPRRWAYFMAALAVGLAAPIAGGLVTEWLAHGERVTQDIQQLGGATPPALRLPLVLVAVGVGPLAEELLFRGVLLSALLQRWRTGWAVAGSALLFALVHLPGLHYQWYALPGLFLLALALAGLRLGSASIWPSLLAHATNNLLAVSAWFVVFNPSV